MTTRADRLVTFLAGLGLLLVGTGFILWRLDVDWVRNLVAHADRAEIVGTPSRAWWPWALGSAAILCLLAAITLLVANLVPRKAGPVELSGSSEFGSFTAHVGHVANAVAALLEQHQGIVSATAVTAVDHGQKVIRVTIVKDPDAGLDHIRRVAADSVREIGSALVGADAAVTVFVQVAAPALLHRRETLALQARTGRTPSG